MLTDNQFSKALKEFHPDLSVRVKDVYDDCWGMYFKSKFIGGIPKEYYSIHDTRNERGSLKSRGLRTVAKMLWHLRQNDLDRFYTLLSRFGIFGKERHNLMQEVTKDTHFNRLKI